MYVPGTKKIISSYDVVFDEIYSSTLANMSQTYAESMAIRPAVSYTPYDTYSRGETGNILTLA